MRVLIVDEMHPSMVQLLEEVGVKPDYNPSLNYDSAKEIIPDYHGLIIRSKFFIGDDFLSNATNLKFIGRAGAGLDLIDLDVCKERGIAVFGANEANSVAVAEHTLGMILSLMNNINKSSNEVRESIWEREENRGEELFGRTVGIIGFGNNGSATARRFAAFGCKVLVYDKFKTGFAEANIYESTMKDIFDEAQILSLHIPLTADTRQMINDEYLASFKHKIYFCNLARGEIVNHSSLVKALRETQVKGACLDVLENEKLMTLDSIQRDNFEYLKSNPKVLMTPHIAGWTVESYEKINLVLRDKIKSFLELMHKSIVQ